MRDKLARSNAQPVMVQAIIDVRPWLFFCSICALAAPCGAQIYASNPDPQGSVVLSNFSSEATPNLVVRQSDALPAQAGNEDGLATSRASSPLRAGGLRAEIDQVVKAVASNVGVPAELLHAVIQAESNYEQTAISPKGAIGLMQVMPATARRFGVADLHDIRSNVLAGATYLKWLIAYFDGRLELALAGYNAGEQAVVRAGRQIPAYPETRAYVSRVLKRLPPGFAATS
jgi:lysozyme